jgi:predicted amidohydrolase YtcJ
MTPADLILTGGPLLGPEGHPRHGHAVAVRDGRIVAVVPEHAAPDLRGPRTEIIDLRGRLLMPGFVDAHAHPVWGGLERLACDLLESPRTVADYQHRIAECAAAHPDWPWISGGGWSFEAFPRGRATAAMLDAVVRDRPVVLFNRDHHGVWANTRALREAGVTAATPDPPDGRIERDSTGAPSGVLHEGAASLVTDLLPPPSAEMLDAALDEAQRHLVPLGITGWVDAILGEYAGQPDPLPAYLRAATTGRLDVRATGALWWDRTRGVEQLDDLLARQHQAAEAGFATPFVKIMADGIVENRTAALLEDYLDPDDATAANGAPTGQRGISFVPREALLEALPALERAGFGVHVHAIGDRAVRDTLDSVAHADRHATGRQAPPVPHQIAHLQIVTPADVPRFAALGVVAVCQALWACHEPQMLDFTLPVLGHPRQQWQYPFAAIAAAGGRLALGSDWPVSSADPWQAVHVAVTRTPPDEPDAEPFLPEQALTLAAALHAGTAGSTFAAGLRDTGRIAPGTRADLVVASPDPFSVPSHDLASVRTDLVLLAGRVVAAAGFDDPA